MTWFVVAIRVLQRRAPDHGRPAAGFKISLRPALAPEEAIALESLVSRRTRPVLSIHDNDIKLDFVDKADSEIRSDRLKRPNHCSIAPFARSAASIYRAPGSTGWVPVGSSPRNLVTNRHVAQEFAIQKGDGYTFQTGPNGQISADIDFLQEIDNPATLVFKLTSLAIEEEPGPDLSFFEVEIPRKLEVGGPDRARGPDGYNGERRDHRLSRLRQPYSRAEPHGGNLRQDLQQETARARRRDECRTDAHSAQLHHSRRQFRFAVIDLDSGKALGLHFSGSFLATNYAVRADVVKQLLDKVAQERYCAPKHKFGAQYGSLSEPCPTIV